MKQQQFRKKPVVIEAMRLTKATQSAIAQWALEVTPAGEVVPAVIPSVGAPLLVHTLEGTMSAEWGDWIIRGVQGEFYPCKHDIFMKTYEPVPR